MSCQKRRKLEPTQVSIHYVNQIASELSVRVLVQTSSRMVSSFVFFLFRHHLDRTIVASFHGLCLRGRRFDGTVVDFVIALRRHASCHGTKDSVRDTSDDTSGNVHGINVGHTGGNVATAGQNLQTIGASNQTNIVLVQSQVVPFPNDHGGRLYGQSRTTATLETHARTGTGFFAALAGLQAATSTKIALTTLVILPSRTGLDVIEGFFAQINLGRTKTENCDAATTNVLAARNLTERELELFLSFKATILFTIFPLLLVLRQGSSGKDAHFGLLRETRKSKSLRNEATKEQRIAQREKNSKICNTSATPRRPQSLLTQSKRENVQKKNAKQLAEMSSLAVG